MIAYDTNLLIYALEGQSEWSKAAQIVIEEGEHEGAILSVLAWQELVSGALIQNTGADVKVAQALRDLRSTRFVPVSQKICETALSLTRRYGKRVYGYDAIHLATAIEYKARFFVTNDKSLVQLHLDELFITKL